MTELNRLMVATGGLLVRRDHPDLASSIDWAVRKGQLTPVLPGVYAASDLAGRPETRMRAVCLRYPDAVLLTAAAARVSFWPKVPLTAIEVSVPSATAPRAGLKFCRRRIPPDLVVTRGVLRYTAPDLTAIDMSTFSCCDAIDRALRTRKATLSGMYEALARTRNRIGNPERARLLLDSRDLPWSAAERLGHRILRRAGISGWQANIPVFLQGQLYYIDVGFRRLKVAVEIDGRLHEEDEDLFQSDRWRQNALVADGWRVLRFTWEMLQDHPEVVVAAVRSMVA